MSDDPKTDSVSAAAPKDLTPSPIGVWLPQVVNGERVFVRPEAAMWGDDWSPRKCLVPKTTPLPLRVCLIGESTAAGFFYAPHLTPAMVLEDQLREVKGAGAYEVVDLTKVDMTAAGGKHDLVRVTVAALQLNPDVLVIFAGNNWLTPIRPFSSSSRDHFLRFAPAYREAGVRGIMDLCERDTLSHYQGVVTNLSYIAAAARIPTILVIPEVNHLDWERGFPVAWLSGERTPQWHKLYRQAMAHAKTSDSSGGDFIAAIAEQMIELDEGTCPVSYRLLGNALFTQGRIAEAREIYIREVDSAAWTPEALPGAGTTIREVLRKGAEQDGLAGVDLPAIFFEHSGNIPGREFFLDYCHLTLRGIKVAMAAVASQVLRLTAAPEEEAYEWRSLLRSLPDPQIPPARDSMAKFLAALYTLHWERLFNGPSPLPEYWCEAAIQAWGDIQEIMLDYVATRVAPATICGLSLAEQHFSGRRNCLEDGSHVLSGEGRRLGRVNLDPAGIELISTVLERSGQPTRQTINKMLVDQHAVRSGGVELLNPYYHWTTMDHLTGFQSDSITDTGFGLYQAFWPASHFCFVSDSSRDVQLNLTARLPAAVNERRKGAVVNVSVNGHHLGTFPIGLRWTCRALNIVRESLRTGTNKLTIHWPDLSPEGDAATRQIRERLEHGVPVNLPPVFGELHSLVARS
jgi:hypothetical protein